MARFSRASGLVPLGGVLRSAKDLRAPAAVEASPIAYADWEAAVGSRVAARAMPYRLERGTLWIRAVSAAWAQELSLLSETIIQQLSARGVAVRALRFRVGAVEPPALPPDRRPPRRPPTKVALPPDVALQVAAVDDPALREAIAAAAALNLGWQATRGRAHANRPTARRDGVATPETGDAAARRASGREPSAEAPTTSASRAARAPRGAAPGTARSDPSPQAAAPSGRRRRP